MPKAGGASTAENDTQKKKRQNKEASRVNAERFLRQMQKDENVTLNAFADASRRLRQTTQQPPAKPSSSGASSSTRRLVAPRRTARRSSPTNSQFSRSSSTSSITSAKSSSSDEQSPSLSVRHPSPGWNCPGCQSSPLRGESPRRSPPPMSSPIWSPRRTPSPSSLPPPNNNNRQQHHHEHEHKHEHQQQQQYQHQHQQQQNAGDDSDAVHVARPVHVRRRRRAINDENHYKVRMAWIIETALQSATKKLVLHEGQRFQRGQALPDGQVILGLGREVGPA